MNYRLIKIDNLSGNKASLYSIIGEHENKNLFQQFIDENFNSHKSEILNIVSRLKSIGNKTGAREHYFKTKEGAYGDSIWALYDVPNSNLRLYIIHFGVQLIILGGGGPKNVRALQEDPKLKHENYLLRSLSKVIDQRIADKEIKYIENGLDFSGNLEFDEIEEI